MKKEKIKRKDLSQKTIKESKVEDGNYSVMEPQTSVNMTVMMDHNFWYDRVGWTCKVNTPTLKSICKRQEWNEIRFETY